MPEPTKIPCPFADSGDKNSIPDSSGALGFASWQEGFPAITGTPFAQGGVAPKRADFNGIFNALSLATVWQQQGGFYAYDATTDYEVGNVVVYSGDLYKCLSANGPSSAVKSPTDATVWAKVILTTATTSAAGYMSAADKLKLDNIQPMTGASAILAGASGLVPQPAAGDQAKALLGNGDWGDLTDIAGTLPIGKGGTGQSTAYNAYKAFIDGSSSDKQNASRSSATVNNSPQFWYRCAGNVVYVGVYFQLVNALSSFSSVVVATGFPNNACADAGTLAGMHCIASDNMALTDCGISITSSGDCKLSSRGTSIPANTWVYAEFVYPRSL